MKGVLSEERVSNVGGRRRVLHEGRGIVVLCGRRKAGDGNKRGFMEIAGIIIVVMMNEGEVGISQVGAVVIIRGKHRT